MHELVGVREVNKDIQKKFISGKTHNTKYCTHFKELVFGDIHTSKVHEDNEAYLKLYTMPRMYPCTKHIYLPYHLFCSKVEAP